MYILSSLINDIRSISYLWWEVRQGPHGWHVIIGDNGAGKSTFLRSIALALVGPNNASALRQDWNDWLRRGSDTGYVVIQLMQHKGYDYFSGKGRHSARHALMAMVRVFKSRTEVGLSKQSFDIDFIKKIAEENKLPTKISPDAHVWGGKYGWFSASYGPFRRFEGGDKEQEKLYYSHPRLAAHLSVFGENIALTESIRWLQDLQFKKLEKHPEGNLLDFIFDFVNQEDFLPHKARLNKISSDGVEFIDGNGCVLPVEELSDGYRSILSMTFELIRQLTRVYDLKDIFDEKDHTKIKAPGVVLIDEIDAHLHPTWQVRIGEWFTKHFPKLQFIVTTHSPLICRSATTVFRLPKPGSDEEGRMIEGDELNRLRLGNVLDAYGTELFGEDVTSSDESKEKRQRLAELNIKEKRGKLTAAEKKEQESLRAAMPTTAHTESTNNKPKPKKKTEKVR